MNFLSVEKLSKSYGTKDLFDNISFGLSKGEKVALIAKNGAGKSTLLRIISGEETPDSGSCAFRNDLKVSFLKQEPDFEKDLTILETALIGQEAISKAILNYEEALLNPEDVDKFQDAMDKMDSLNAWDYDSRVKEALTLVHLDDFKKKVSILSGGQKKRLALAQIILDEPDFLILDEPTNHLDMDIIEWLETFLSKSNTTLLMVTHDRYFLENVCNSIIEIDRNTLFKYQGNYSEYLNQKEERIQTENIQVDKAQNLMKKELEWMRRQPKARGTKAKYRVDAFEGIKEKASKKTNDDALELDVSAARMGKKIIELKKVSKAFPGQTVLNDFTYTFVRGERLGIVGPNGVGKTTFLNLLTGDLAPDSGDIDKGVTLSVGYFNQMGLEVKEDKRIIDIVKDKAEFITLSNGVQVSASKMLERFLFDSKQQYAYFSTLSGGEKRRLNLLTVLMGNPNFLILDEPTNDLDILTINVLEDFLENFGGCLVLVSHDRFLIDKLCQHLFIFEGNGVIRDFNGGYSDYRADKLEREKEAVQKKKEEQNNKDKEKAKTTNENKLSYKEKMELDALLEEIPQLEENKKALEEKLAGLTDPEEIVSVSAEYEKLTLEIDAKTERWLELEG